MAKSGSGDGSAGGNGRGCGYENSNASRGDYSTEESFAAMGATQASFTRKFSCCRHSFSLVYIVEPTVCPALTLRESANRKYRLQRSVGLDDTLGLRR